MPMISENWANLLLPALKRVFFQGMDERMQSIIPMLFNVQTSTRDNEKTLGVEDINQIPEYKGALEYADWNEGYLKTFTFPEYALAISIERKLYDDAQYNIMNQRALRLGLSFARTRETHAASVFNNAFTAGDYAGTDTKALCATDHPYGVSNATTASNKGTSELSVASVISTYEAMLTTKSPSGGVHNVIPDMLLVPPTLAAKGWEIINSTLKPDTGNNNANFVQGQGMKVVTWNYLTDTNNWFMVDSQLAMMHLHWFNRIQPEFEFDPTGSYNLKSNYRGYARWGYGFDDWRFIYGHAVA